MLQRVLLFIAGSLVASCLAFICPAPAAESNQIKYFPYLDTSSHVWFPTTTGNISIAIMAQAVANRSDVKITLGSLDNPTLAYPDARYWTHTSNSDCSERWVLLAPWSLAKKNMTRVETDETVVFTGTLFFHFSENITFPGEDADSNFSVSTRSWVSSLTFKIRFTKRITLESVVQIYKEFALNWTVTPYFTVDLYAGTLTMIAESSVNFPYILTAVASFGIATDRGHFAGLNYTSSPISTAYATSGVTQDWSFVASPNPGVCSIADVFLVTVNVTCQQSVSACPLPSWYQQVQLLMDVSTDLYCGVIEVVAALDGTLALYPNAGMYNDTESTSFAPGATIVAKGALSSDDGYVTSSSVDQVMLIGPAITGYSIDLYNNGKALAGNFVLLNATTVARPAFSFVMAQSMLNTTGTSDRDVKVLVQMTATIVGTQTTDAGESVQFSSTTSVYVNKIFTLSSGSGTTTRDDKRWWWYPVIGVVGGVTAGALIVGLVVAAVNPFK